MSMYRRCGRVAVLPYRRVAVIRVQLPHISETQVLCTYGAVQLPQTGKIYVLYSDLSREIVDFKPFSYRA